VTENEFKIRFAVPGTTNTTTNVLGTAATAQGFGGVFVDVNEAKLTKMVVYAKSGCVISEEFVKPEPAGLSFLGFFAGNDTDPIYEIQVVLGSQALDAPAAAPVDVCDIFCSIIRFFFGGAPAEPRLHLRRAPGCLNDAFPCAPKTKPR